MTIFRNVVMIAAIAGLFSGVVMTALQSFATVPLILHAETYEGQAVGHEHGAAASSADATAPAVTEPAHEHNAEAWAPADGFERFAYTALANIVTAIGFALILVAVSDFAGGIGSWRAGVFWGLAGFACFTLAPGLGLPPELPGMPAADLGARQVWWVVTAAATAGGLALLAFRGTALFSLVGVALIIAPHVIGAPQPVSHETAVPADLHHSFVVWVTITNLVFWVVLGGLVAVVRGWMTGSSAKMRDSFA